MCTRKKMHTSNAKNKEQDNRLTTKGHFRRPRQDYLQDSVSQCNAAVDKESLCKVSDYEVSLHSKFNLPNIQTSEGKGRAIYWLYKHNLADSQSVRERLKTGNNKRKLYAIGNFMQVARETPDTFLKRLRLRKDLSNLREMFLKGQNSEIEIKETYNSYLNLDDIYSLHLYLKSNEPLTTDQYRNLALNLEIKGNLLKEIQKASQKCKQEYILPKMSHTNAQKNQRVYLENYISKYKAGSTVSGGRAPSKTIIYPFQAKSKPDQKLKKVEPSGDKETNILTRSGLSINDLEHILNQINFIIKGEHFDQETEIQKTKLQRYLHSISTESNLCEVKKENNLCILDNKINEGLQNSMRDLIKQLAFKSKSSSLRTEPTSCKINENLTRGSNSLKKCRAKSNIFISSSGAESSSNEKVAGKKTKEDQSLTCFKCDSSGNTSSDENLFSNICMKNRTLCSLNQNHKGDILKEYELAAKQISQELAEIKRNRSQGDNTIIKNKSKENTKDKKALNENQKKTDLLLRTGNNYVGDAVVQGQPLSVEANHMKTTKRRSRSPKCVNIKLKDKGNKYHNRRRQKSKERVRYKEVEETDEDPDYVQRCTQEKKHTDYEDSGQHIEVKHLRSQHTASQTDHRERLREEGSNTEERLGFVDSKQKSKVDSGEQYRIQDIGQSWKGIYKDQPTQYQPELPARNSYEVPSRDVDVKKVTNSKVTEGNVEKYGSMRTDKWSNKENKEGRYSPMSQSYKNYLRRIHRKKEVNSRLDVGEETGAQEVNERQHKTQTARAKQDLNYLCFEDALQVSSDSFCDRAKKKAKAKSQPRKQEAPNPLKQQIESLDDLIERVEGITDLRSRTWTGIPQVSSKLPCKETKSDKKLIKSYQEDISNKMARSYDYFISTRRKRESEENVEELGEDIGKDSEELIDKVDYENYLKRSQEKYFVNRISVNASDDVPKYQSKREILRTINEKETVDDCDFKYQDRRNKRTKSRRVNSEVLRRQIKRSNSGNDSDEENVCAFNVSSYRDRRSNCPNLSETENTDVGDDFINRNLRSTSRNVTEREDVRVDDDFKYRSRRKMSQNLNERDEVDDFKYRNKSNVYRNLSERENIGTDDYFKHRSRRGTSQNLGQRENIDDEEHFKYRNKRSISGNLNERNRVDFDDGFKFQNDRSVCQKISEDDYANIDDAVNYQRSKIKESESNMQQSSSVIEESTTTMTNSENLCMKSTDELLGIESNQMVSACSLSSLEKFLLDERACKIDSSNLEADTYPSEIPIYKEGYEIARLTHGSNKINKSTQMFEHVTKNDLYTLQWIHDNLFEININPHTLIVDEKLKEVSEESRLS